MIGAGMLAGFRYTQHRAESPVTIHHPTISGIPGVCSALIQHHWCLLTFNAGDAGGEVGPQPGGRGISQGLSLLPELPAEYNRRTKVPLSTLRG